MPISLLIADDHHVVRSGLSTLLEGADIAIIGEASSGNEAVDKTLELKPDVVLMDIRMMEGDGLSALERIREQCPGMPVVMLSTFDNPTYIARSLAHGARDYVLKGSPREELIEAIQRAVRGDAPAQGSVTNSVREAMEKRAKPDSAEIPLTKREMQVLRHVALGLSNREIGKSLHISVDTVKEHVQNIFKKLGISDRTQAAVWALKNSLV